MIARILLAASAAAGMSTGFPTPHPHHIVSAADAIATACQDWKAQYPLAGADNALWQKDFTAVLNGRVWTIMQTTTLPSGRKGTIIKLSAQDGHIIATNKVN